MKSLPVIRFGRGQQRMWYSCAIGSRKKKEIKYSTDAEQKKCCFLFYVSGFVVHNEMNLNLKK